jgi:hypothetical protein
MSQREVAITGGPYGTKAMVTGQEELLVKVNNTIPVQGTVSVEGGGADGSVNVITGKSGLLTPISIYRFTSNSTIASGLNSKITLQNVGAGNATVDVPAYSGGAVALKPTESIVLEAQLGRALPSVVINATGTEVLTVVTTLL